jgi:hypothetical protein
MGMVGGQLGSTGSAHVHVPLGQLQSISSYVHTVGLTLQALASTGLSDGQLAAAVVLLGVPTPTAPDIAPPVGEAGLAAVPAEPLCAVLAGAELAGVGWTVSAEQANRACSSRRTEPRR